MNTGYPFQEPGDVLPPSPPPRLATIKTQARKPYVTYTMIGLCVIVFILQYASIFLWGGDILSALGAKINTRIINGEIWRLITPMFLHGSLIHLAVNMYSLYVIGRGLEMHYGNGRYAILYFVSGFAGNVLSFVFTPAASLGASTALFGLFVAQGVFIYQNRKIFGVAAQRALSQLVMVGLFNLVMGLSARIDNWGHIGGLVGGLIFAWFAGPVLQPESYYPDITLADSRENHTAVVTGLAVGGLFTLLAAVVIFLRTV